MSVGRIPHSKMKDYYKSVSFVVSTSLSEGFPNVLLEAMAAGCPIVTSDIDGIYEYVTHLKSAYVYKRGDTVALVNALYYMFTYPEKAKMMAKQAKKNIKKLDYDIYFENLLKFIETGKSVNLLK
jgi:glycosyltransferase involved in cell wall biosynthesis